jgi:hypothetical protein
LKGEMSERTLDFSQLAWPKPRQSVGLLSQSASNNSTDGLIVKFYC